MFQRDGLDARNLEARTQAIGKELFTLAKREHAHLSALNRWTAQLLSWCLGDVELKANVLRFIDVLPTLHSPRSVARHLKEYFPSSNKRIPIALRLGTALARPGLLTARAVSAVVHQLVEQVARQFIAGTRPKEAPAIIQTLVERGAVCSFDVLGEQVLSEDEADAYLRLAQELLEEIGSAYGKLKQHPKIVCGPLANLSIKPSALTPRFDAISPSQTIARAVKRLKPLLDQAGEMGALINLDMEQYERRDVTLAMVRHLLKDPDIGRRVELGIVIQTYLRDSETVTDALLEWLAANERSLTIRLVKGAYWDYEVAQAAQACRQAPVFRNKAESDLVFERLTQRLLSAQPLVTTAIASHNVRSIAHAMAVAEQLGLAKGQLEFQVLYGMGDALIGAISARGYAVRVYTPVGELIPGMAYLVRRILENTANESFMRQDFLEERSSEELLSPPVVLESNRTLKRDESKKVGWTGEPLVEFSNLAEQGRMASSLNALRDQLGKQYPLEMTDKEVEFAESLTSRNPADPKMVLGHISLASPIQVNHAMVRADAAQERWAVVPVTERAQLLRKAASRMRQLRFELAAWTVLEVGKTWREADADITEAIDFLEYYSHRIERLGGRSGLLQVPGERNELQYFPRGIAVVIAPWNFPVAILTGMSAAALAGGNVVILKPAEQSSLVGLRVARILREAGFPQDVVQCLPGWGNEVGAALVRHAATRQVLFTGSRAVGLSIIQICGNVETGQRFVKHVVAEMGGKNAVIVDEDADLDAAVEGVLASAFGYAGQKCSAASRAIVHAAVYERFVERLSAAADRLVVGDPSNPETDMGPLIEEGAMIRLREAIAQAQEVGRLAYQYPEAKLPKRGYFVGPTIAVDIPASHSLATQELFGPLLCVFRVHSFVEALELANDTDYALTGGIYSRSPANVDKAIAHFDVGNLYINRKIAGAAVGRQPFGGHRLSGLGTKAGGPDTLLQTLLAKTVTTNTARHGIPLE